MKSNYKIVTTIILSLISYLSGYGQDIFINEVQYQNKTTLTDTTGSTSDWIELYNAGNITINLSGYQLSDDADLIDCWTFPEININPGEYLIIFASGKDSIIGNECHTDFKLKIMVDPLFLLNSNGEIIDEIVAQCVPTDKSLGCYPDGSDDKQVLSPTPGRTNNSADVYEINYMPDSLIISDPSGFYGQEIELKLSCLNQNNNIVYTLDGSDPKFDDSVYNMPINLYDINGNENRFANMCDDDLEVGNQISKANILRAKVYSEGCPASNEIANTYFISESNAFKYNIPVVSVITDKDNLFDDETGVYVAGNNVNYSQHGKDWERQIHLEIFDSIGTQIINQDAGVRINGRGSRTRPQKSLRLYARDEYGRESFDFPFFSQKPELNSFKTLVLRSTYWGWSGTLFKDEMCHHLVQDMNIDYSASQTAIVFINGEYWGVYSLRERYDEYYVNNNYGIENPDLDIIGYNESELLIESGTIDNYNDLNVFFQTEDPENPEFYNKVSERIDIKNVIDFYIAHIYFSNTDFVNNNLKTWRNRNDTSVWRFFFFDMDGSMYRAEYNLLAEYHNIDDEFHIYPEYSTLILKTLLKNQQFENEFYARFNYHLNHTFSAERVVNYIDQYQELYKTLVPEHIYRWSHPSDYSKWLDDVEMLRTFAMQRPIALYNQLEESFNNPFTVYPNPSKGDFTINFYDNTSSKYIRIIDMQGRILLDNAITSSKEYSMSTSLRSGLYLLNIQIENVTYVEKIIIKP